MIRLFLNCLAANAGGGLTYLRNVVPHLSARTDVQTMVAASAGLKCEIGEPPNLWWADIEPARGAGRRLWQEQTRLPQMIRDWNADVLISAGNFALRKSPVPQILLSGNSLYTSADFFHDLRSRRAYRLLLDTRLKGIIAKRSVGWADCTVAPSEAFAQDLRRWTGAPIIIVYHGFDHENFCADSTPLPVNIQQKLDSAKDALRLLFVSHYNYYRNFETLIRAISILTRKLHPRAIRLILTCKLASKDNPGSYQADTAAELVRHLKLDDEVVELGAVSYAALHHLYRSCDVYATPAYAETFAHPLVEAMASGLPVIASDLPVHREICGEAALYFPRFAPEMLAERIIQVSQSAEQRATMREMGLSRSRDFSWDRHVDELLVLARRLASLGVKDENADASRKMIGKVQGNA